MRVWYIIICMLGISSLLLSGCAKKKPVTSTPARSARAAHQSSIPPSQRDPTRPLVNRYSSGTTIPRKTITVSGNVTWKGPLTGYTRISLISSTGDWDSHRDFNFAKGDTAFSPITFEFKGVALEEDEAMTPYMQVGHAPAIATGSKQVTHIRRPYFRLAIELPKGWVSIPKEYIIKTDLKNADFELQKVPTP